MSVGFSLKLSKNFAAILCFTALLFFPAKGKAQNTMAITGTVMTNDTPLANVDVYLHPTKRMVKTDSEGKFRFGDLEEGSYVLHVETEDFHLYHQKIKVTTVNWTGTVQLERNLLKLQEVSVFGSLQQSSPVATTLPVYQVSREYIEKNGAGTFANSLEKLPGISTINTGVGISKPVIRGMSFNRIMINDRGIKQEGQQWGADHGLEIDPYDVDHVEIIKGPASLVYGSDGMGGVININSPRLPSKDFSASYTTVYNSNNHLFGNTVSASGGRGNFVFSGRFTQQQFGDYRVPASTFNYAGFVLPIFDERLKNTAGNERHFSAMAGYVKGRNYTTLTFTGFTQEAGLFPGAVGIPTSYSLQHRGEHRDIDFPHQKNRHFKVISNTRLFFENFDLEVDLGYQRNLRNEMSLPHTHGQAPTPSGNLALGLSLDTYTANARINRQYNEKLKTVTGLQLQYMQNAKEGFEFLIPDFRSFQSGLFYFMDYRQSEKWRYSAGLRADAAFHEMNAHLQPVYQNQEPTGEFVERAPDAFRRFGNVSGSVGAAYRMSPFWLLKANAGSSFRIPTAVELSMNGVHHGNFRHELGNLNLTPERGYQADLELTYSHAPFRVSASPYFGYYNDYIYLAPSGRFSPLPGAGAFWEYRQNNAIFAGGEFMGNYDVFKGFSIGLGAEYVYNRNLDTRLPLPLTPPLSVLGNVEYNIAFTKGWLKRAYVFGEVRWADDQNRVDRNERTTPGYTLFEAGLGFDFKVKKFAFQLNARAQNLTDAVYFNHLSRYRLLNLPEPGRNISVSLKVSL